MFRSLLIVSFTALLTPSHLGAEEQVTLKSGTMLVGVVSIDGPIVRIKLGKSQVTVPMAEVKQIGPSGQGTTTNDTAQRLLIIALESRLQSKSTEEPIGLLAEAHRLAPDDSRIAYWYAMSLVDGGLGTEAKKVFEAKREGIAHAYPGMVDKLANLIQQRLALDGLPAPLAAKLERLNAGTGHSMNSNLVPKYVRFRVLDQNAKPIDKSAVSVVCYGNDKDLMDFADGYYLLTYNSYRSADKDCDLVVNWPGLDSKQFKLKAAADQVRDAGVFVVPRLDESSKVPYKFVVIDPAEKPILRAAVTIQPDGSNNGRQSTWQTERTDSGGRTTIKAFPLSYDYNVSAEGFKTEVGKVALTSTSQDHEEQVILYPTIAGTIRYSWSSLENEAPSKTKEIVLPIGQALNTRQLDAVSASWISAVQVKDTVTLQRGPAFYGERSIPGETLWVRRIPDELIKESALEYYSQFDLKNIDSIKEKISETKIHRDKGQRDNFSFPVRQGEVYVGKLPGLNRQTGRPAVVSFKVFVEQVSSKP